MTAKEKCTIENTCDRCDDVETLTWETKGLREVSPDSKGLILTVYSDLQLEDLKYFREREERPETTHELRINLCAACRTAFVKFMKDAE